MAGTLRDTRPKYNSKPPKRRFSVGDAFVSVPDGEKYDIIGAFRLRENPHEWIWVLGSLTPLRAQSVGSRLLDEYVASTTELICRIVVDPFRSSMDASSYFMQIPPRPGLRGDIVFVFNKNLLNLSKWKRED